MVGGRGRFRCFLREKGDLRLVLLGLTFLFSIPAFAQYRISVSQPCNNAGTSDLQPGTRLNDLAYEATRRAVNINNITGSTVTVYFNDGKAAVDEVRCLADATHRGRFRAPYCSGPLGEFNHKALAFLCVLCVEDFFAFQ